MPQGNGSQSGAAHSSFVTRDKATRSAGLSGARFFPPSFYGSAPGKRQKKKARTRSSLPPPTPALDQHRQVKARLRLWKRLREVLNQHLHIPEAEEEVLIQLAEHEAVRDNEDGLEGWTAFQLLNKVSEGATAGFEILTLAVEDIIASLGSKGHSMVRIRSSNITQWRAETQKWLAAQRDDIILVQETHLGRLVLQGAVAAMHKVGYETVALPAKAPMVEWLFWPGPISKPGLPSISAWKGVGSVQWS